MFSNFMITLTENQTNMHQNQEYYNNQEPLEKKVSIKI